MCCNHPFLEDGDDMFLETLLFFYQTSLYNIAMTAGCELLSSGILSKIPHWAEFSLKADCSSGTQDIILNLWYPKVHYRCINSLPLIPVVNYIYPIHDHLSYFYSQFRYHPPFYAWVSHVVSSHQASTRNRVHITLLPCACHMSCPSHPPWFDHPNGN
jgi:hypothetical protein